MPYSENKENDEEDPTTAKSSKKHLEDEETKSDKYKLDTSIAKEKSPILKESQKNQGHKGYFNYKKAQRAKQKEWEETKEKYELSKYQEEGKGKLIFTLILRCRWRHMFWRGD